MYASDLPDLTILPWLGGGLTLLATWIGVMAAVLKFAAGVGELTSTVGALKEAITKVDAKLEALPRVEAQVASHQEKIETILQSHTATATKVNQIELHLARRSSTDVSS